MSLTIICFSIGFTCFLHDGLSFCPPQPLLQPRRWLPRPPQVHPFTCTSPDAFIAGPSQPADTRRPGGLSPPCVSPVSATCIPVFSCDFTYLTCKNITLRGGTVLPGHPSCRWHGCKYHRKKIAGMAQVNLHTSDAV